MECVFIPPVPNGTGGGLSKEPDIEVFLHGVIPLLLESAKVVAVVLGFDESASLAVFRSRSGWRIVAGGATDRPNKAMASSPPRSSQNTFPTVVGMQ